MASSLIRDSGKTKYYDLNIEKQASTPKSAK